MDKALEIRRNVVHLLLGNALIILLNYNIINTAILGLITLLPFIISYGCRNRKIIFLEWILDKLERAETRKRFPGKGLLFYLLGAELSLLLFSRDIALAAIIILAFGDSVPNIFGIYFRRIKHPFSDKKFLEGVILGWIFSFLAAMTFIAWYEALTASFAAMVIEGLDMKIGFEKIDDNLIIPLGAGAIIFLIRLIF
ncbi:MAG: hypothetical protein KAQ85_08515 [Thermodesulfovibrionia bacterium]|nr:hypothetical protein [Thermodesulfovibrionia bacterium]